MHILCIHDIVDDAPASPWEIRAADFEAALLALRARRYRFCAISDVRGPDERGVVLTFDDAPAGAVHWTLDRASAFALQAVIYPVVCWLDDPPPRSPAHNYRRLASWRDIERAHGDGHEIGSHGMRHRRLNELEDAELRYELHQSKTRLEARCGAPVQHLAAPYGQLSEEVILRAHAAGYTTVSSTVPGANNADDLARGTLKRTTLRSDVAYLGLSALLHDN